MSPSQAPPAPDVGPRPETLGRVAARFALAFLIAAGFSALATPLVAPHVPGRSPEKLARTLLIPGFVAAYILLGRRRRPPLRIAVGLAVTPRVAGRQAAAGFLVGVASLAAYLAALVAVGAWSRREPAYPAGRIAVDALKYLPAGLFLALWEEALFRGLLFGDLERAAGRRVAFWGSAAAFGVSHFLRPLDDVSRAGDGAWSGVHAVWQNVAGLSRVTFEAPALIGLLLVGATLAYLRLRTGSIALGIGVHAGWYYVQKMDGRFVDLNRSLAETARLWIGTREHYDGVGGWCALLIGAWLASRVASSESRP